MTETKIELKTIPARELVNGDYIVNHGRVLALFDDAGGYRWSAISGKVTTRWHPSDPVVVERLVESPVTHRWVNVYSSTGHGSREDADRGKTLGRFGLIHLTMQVGRLIGVEMVDLEGDQ